MVLAPREDRDVLGRVGKDLTERQFDVAPQSTLQAVSRKAVGNRGVDTDTRRVDEVTAVKLADVDRRDRRPQCDVECMLTRLGNAEVPGKAVT